MKVCPDCSAEFEDQLNFCRQDGTALQLKKAARPCPSCGENIWNDSKFCRHCGAGLDASKPSTGGEISQTLVLTPSETKEPEIATASSSASDLAEDQLRQGKYREAISTLDAIIKSNPENHEARLLHLYATVKLYNVYGYEKQIEDLRSLSDLSEKEREIVREVFLIRVEEAQKRGKTDEAREYQRLATRVILGQPLIEAAPEHPVLPTQARPSQATAPRISPNVEQQPQSSARPTSRKADASPSYVRNYPGTKKRKSRLVVSFVLVFGLAGILAAGMLAHYAKKQGVDVTDLFKSKPSITQRPEGIAETSKTSPVGQVLAAEELGFTVWGAGAADANRKESVISERIGSQLSDLRQFYQQEVQNKPELLGTVVLQLTISPTGEVTKVEEYVARIRDGEFRKLVINEAYKWRFPEATLGFTKVNYPLLFVPPKMDLATVLQWERAAVSAEPTDKVQLATGPKATEVTGVPSPFGLGIREGSPSESKALRGRSKSGNQKTFSPTGSSKPVDVTSRPPEPQSDLPPASRDKPIIGQYEVLYPTSVYSEPREDSSRVARIEAGTKVNVVDVQGEWLEVRSRQGRPPGFVKKDAATPLSNR